MEVDLEKKYGEFDMDSYLAKEEKTSAILYNKSKIENKFYSKISEVKTIEKLVKIARTLMIKHVKNHLINDQIVSFPKSSMIINICSKTAHINLSRNSIYRSKLGRNYNKETLKVRSAFKNIEKCLERLIDESFNTETFDEVKKVVKADFPKQAVLNYLYLTWLDTGFFVTLLKIKELIARIIYFHYSFVYFTKESKRKAIKEIGEIEKEFRKR